MRIVIENDTYQVRVEVDRKNADDLSLIALIEGLVRPALLAAGYPSVSLDGAFGLPNDSAWAELNEAAGL